MAAIDLAVDFSAFRASGAAKKCGPRMRPTAPPPNGRWSGSRRSQPRLTLAHSRHRQDDRGLGPASGRAVELEDAAGHSDEMHGGIFKLDSTPGSGTEATIILPVSGVCEGQPGAASGGGLSNARLAAGPSD